jgi:uncharacterized protein DUF6998
MSDWEFLYDMHDEGYSSEEIADAAAIGLAPWECEYVSADWIESQLETEPNEQFQSRDGLPYSTLKHIEIYNDLVDCAIRHFENTGRYLQIWGELGEIYAEIKFGLRRHATHTAGSDGTIDGKLVEVKTISPEKASDLVLIKSQGNFEQLLIVKFNQDFEIKAKLIDRSDLKGGVGKFLKGRFEGNPDND